jgi:predicted TIM-barrel fold metal-dependent hydrolase
LEQVKDLKVRLECIKAYNDWLLEEFCATNPKRLVPVALIPPWDVDLAVAETARVARKGYRAVLFGPALDIFGYKPTFDRYWDPFYTTLEEAGMILSFHQPSAAMDRAYFQDPKNPVPGAIKTALNVAHTHSLIYPTAELLLSGILERFPKLKVFLAEAGVSWIPYTLSQADYWWPRNGRWDNNELRMPPSMYWKRQCSAGFWLDYVSPTVVREVGEDNVMWEADYLHTLTTFPQSRFYQEKSLEEIKDQTLREKILWGNAEKLFAIK